MTPNYGRTKLACYSTYPAMVAVFCLPPMLFVTFREMYGISYTLLGTLVLVNFFTQLAVDLVFTFFTKYFNIRKTLIAMPVMTSVGMAIYALVPMLAPQYAYAGLVTGTVIFSLAAGLSEVLLSPTVAALPSKNPDREMSMLHSLYAWGLFVMVVLSALYLKIFGTQNWMYWALALAALPLITCALFATSPIPKMDLAHGGGASSGKTSRRTFGLALCVACIFLGSCAENVMTNWISAYMESALRIPKELGDILGLALFAVLLGTARTLYGKYGKNISAVLLWSMAGSAACYLIAAVSPNVVLSMVACIFTGLFSAMLWPGTLILMEEKFPSASVAAYALMAAGGDFGASIAPQMTGVIVDSVAASPWAVEFGAAIALSPEQVGMKTAMLIAALFPILGTALLVYMKRYFSKKNAL